MRISDWSSDVCSSDLAILYDEPEVVADVQFGQTQFGTLELNAARAQIHYQGGRGNAKLLAEGYSGVPFRIAANGALTPDLWRIALNGRVKIGRASCRERVCQYV